MCTGLRGLQRILQLLLQEAQRFHNEARDREARAIFNCMLVKDVHGFKIAVAGIYLKLYRKPVYVG